MNIYPILRKAIPLDDYRLMLIFGDSEKRIYDFKPNFNHKFYKPLADIRLFNSVEVTDGEIEWVTGHDFCPNTLYEKTSEKELNKQMIDRLLELMVLKVEHDKNNPGKAFVELDRAIIKAKAPMTEEQIAWVEKLVSQW